jgi:hypothetical protein
MSACRVRNHQDVAGSDRGEFAAGLRDPSLDRLAASRDLVEPRFCDRAFYDATIDDATAAVFHHFL